MSSCGDRKWSSLCVGILSIVTIWILVLPWIGSRPSVRMQIEYLDRDGVDPTALYYTDLEAMERVESDIAAISQSHPDAFWRIGSAARSD